MGFPSSIKTFSSKTDNIDEIVAMDINDLQTETTAIETELGTNPKGAAASVKARIEAIEAQFSIAAGKVLTLLKNLTSQGGDGILVWPESGATLSINGNSSVNGANTGDQTITLNGDVTGSGIGSFLATIANKAVTLAKMADMATASFLGRNSSGSGTPEVLSIATAKSMLNLSGTNTGDQTITLTGDVTGTGTGSFATTIANDAVTLAKMANMATASLLGRNSASTGNPEVLSVATVKTMLGFPPGGVRLYRTAVYTLTTSGTLYAIPFTNELQDGDSYHDNSTNNTRITVSEDGWYAVGGEIAFEANTTGVRDVGIRLNGGSTFLCFQRQQASADASRGSDICVATVYYLSSGNYIELMARQYSGGALNVLVTDYSSPSFYLKKLL